MRREPFVAGVEMTMGCDMTHEFSLTQSLRLADSTILAFYHAMPTQLTYYGHAGFKLTTPSGKIVLIDPWLKNPLYDKAEEELKALDRVEIIAITHGHFDHVGDAVEIAKKTRPKLLCTFDLAVALRNALGFPGDGDDSSLVAHFGGE